MRIERNFDPCKKKCKNRKYLDDKYKTEICEDCLEVISYERASMEVVKNTTNTIKKVKSKIVENKNIKIVNKPDLFGGQEIKVKVKPTSTKRKIGEVSSEFEINKVYIEKCEETMKKMKDGEVDYSFTSPPYNVSVGVDGSKYNEYKDDLTPQEYFEWQVVIIRELLRVTKNHVFYNNQVLTDNRISLFTLLDVFKYDIKELCIWKKVTAAPASTRGVMNSKFEIMVIFSNIEPTFRNFKDANFHGNFDNVIEIKKEHNKYASKHKAVFPVALPKTFIQAFGDKGDIWYDPFGGTGTTAEAAILEDRQWVLSEMNESYVTDIINPRLRALKAQTKLEFV